MDICRFNPQNSVVLNHHNEQFRIIDSSGNTLVDTSKSF